MKDLLSHHRFFFLLAGSYLMLGFFLVSITSMGTIEFFFYKNHTPILTFYFKLLNWLGDGMILLFVLPLIGLLFSVRAMLITGGAVLISFLVVSLLKNFVFPEADRPLRYFGDAVIPYLIDGMERNMHNSFPSGHSAQAMALMASFSFVIRTKGWQLVLLLLAVSTALARVYLMQHFYVDTLAGGTIALVISLAGIYLYKDKSPWDASLWQIVKTKGRI
ncbi:MAG: phosphatase PAP2 family protein [Cytophagaceae bacterium]|jgi:undecaprenyl-diphosphatase|nr:phosphatase PAP2 family protein [Cytophagaceae bacterium]